MYTCNVEVEPLADSIMAKFKELFASSEIYDHVDIQGEAINWLKIADSRTVYSKLAKQIVARFSPRFN